MDNRFSLEGKIRKALLVAIVPVCASCSGSHTITVENQTELNRCDEIVEVDINALTGVTSGAFVILDQSGEEIPYQLTHDTKLIFPVSVKANDKVTFTIGKGKPALTDTFVCGRMVPERLDDMAWENDLCAYRAYGPALQKTGERAFGYDIWTKSVHEPVVDQRYYDHIKRNISFHEDHGKGMDVYAVGPTLGGGTAALLDSLDNIVYPYCYQDFEILDNGPLRFTVRLTYGNSSVDNDSTVTETRVISLDKGDFLNRTTVRYDGLSSGKKLAPGIVIHRQNPDAYILHEDKGYMAYADLTQDAEAGNGTIFIGIVSPESKQFTYKALTEPNGDAVGHILAPADYRNGTDFTYWWGAGWSKGFMPDMATWTAKLEDFAKRKAAPLTVTVD